MESMSIVIIYEHGSFVASPGEIVAVLGPSGEGKTTTTIGLADGLKRIGKDVTVASRRQPALVPRLAEGTGTAVAVDGQQQEHDDQQGTH